MQKSYTLDYAHTCAMILNIQLPTTVDEIKAAFRQRSKEGPYRHPDVGGSGSQFRQLVDAFNFLKDGNIPGTIKSGTAEEKIRSASYTQDGHLLVELGKGLGSTKNGSRCESCNGKGYATSLSRTKWDSCRICRGRGFVRHHSGAEKRCWKCFGMGGMHVAAPSEAFHFFCHKCNGTGEIELFNPVFPKMRVS